MDGITGGSAVIGNILDITRRKLLERQVYETQRLESIGLLASGIAHDLNNILTPILLSMQVLRLKDPKEEHATLDMIEQCVRRGTGISTEERNGRRRIRPAEALCRGRPDETCRPVRLTWR